MGAGEPGVEVRGLPMVTVRVQSQRFHLHGFAVDRSGRPAKQVTVRVGARVIPCESPWSSPEDSPPEWKAVPWEALFEVRFQVGPGLKCIRVEAEWEDGTRTRLAQAWQLTWIRALRPYEGRHYRDWLARHFRPDREGLRKRIESLRERPLFSVLMPVYNTPPELLEAAVTSVLRQDYRNWELCIADDASTKDETRAVLAGLSQRDERIRLVRREKNGHIAAASNSALEMARGDYVALLDHDDELSWDALGEVACWLRDRPVVRWVYSDEDKLTPRGKREGPYLKPDWNPDLLRSQNYICHLSVMERELVNRVGGFREGYEGAQDWDLFLRLSREVKKGEVSRIPKVLYHWRMVEGSTALRLDDKEYANDAGFRALEDDARALGIRARHLPCPGGYWRRMHLEAPSRVLYLSLEGMDDVLPIPESWKHVTVPSATPSLEVLGEASRVHPDVDVLVFQYRRFRKADKGALEELVSQGNRSTVALAGGRILSRSGMVDHAGLVLGDVPAVWPAFFRSRPDLGGMGSRSLLVQSYAAVAGGVVAFRSECLHHPGMWVRRWSSWDACLVDFGLQLQIHGCGRPLYSPFACFRLEGEGFREPPGEDIRQLKAEWASWFANDPAFHPGLEPGAEEFRLARQPRRLTHISPSGIGGLKKRPHGCLGIAVKKPSPKRGR